MMLAYFLVGCCIVASGLSQITFVVPPSDIVVARGSPALFDCSITSSVSVSITWQKDGTAITPTSRISFLSNNSLLIDQTQTGDEGVYACVVTSTMSSLSSSQNASLIFAFILDSFLVDPESQTVDEGRLVQMFCIHGGSTPPATISWTLNGTTIFPSSRINIASSVLLQTNPPQVTSTLTIVGVQRSSDMGTVRCVATNPLLLSSPVSSAPATLTIRAQPTPPAITSSPTDLIVMNGAPASLSCSATGEPSPMIVWSLNGSVISITGGITVDRRDTTSVLSIASTSSANTGSYSCRASNSEGAASSLMAQLQIASLGGIFELEPTDTTVLLGDVAVLDCTAPPSIPPAAISWSMNSVPINSSRHRVFQNGSLSVSAVELGDAAMYRCTATNSFIGSSVNSREVTLSVLGVPSVTPPTISVAVGLSAMFTCNAIGSIPPTIQWLKGSNPITSDTDSRITVNGNSLTIRDIIVQDSEYYTCRTTLSSLSTTTRAILTVQAPPSFTSPVLNLTAILSNPVSLPCSTLPDPAINFTWYFEGMALSPETSGGNLQISDTGTLSISSVAMSSAGTYTCMAVNTLGSANGTVQVQVFFLPSLTAASSIVTVVQGATATLQCSSEGNPIPIHFWTQNGNPIAGSRFQISENGRTLTISDSVEQDEDTYICLASNSVGNVSANIVLEVQVPPSAMASPSNQTLITGNTATFTCSATGDPNPQIVWSTANGIDVSTNSRYQLSTIPGGGVALTISNLQPSDEQTLTCSATNVVSTAASVVSLFVLVSPSVSLLTLITGIQGRSLTLDCSPTGRPAPTVNWLRDGTQLQANSRVTIDSQGALVFNPLFSTDASSYTCIASNSIGNDSATTSLVVQVAPVIQALTPSVTANTGSSAVLDCTSSGNPVPTITWTFNSAPVLPAGMPRIEQASNNSLVFSEVLASDEGSYLCQAINAAGTETATIELIVYEAPLVTAQPSSVTGTAGTSVTLRCMASGDPIPTQTWTRNGAALTDPRFTIQSGGSELLIQSVMEADQGQYSCVASNQAGSGSATVNLNVISVPVVSLPVTSLAITAGTSAMLECGASGDPAPTVVWFYNSVQVPNSATPHISQALNNSLLFSLVQFSDRGQYVCRATNAAGQDSASLQLTVYVTPTISAEQSSVTAVRGTSITLTCSATGEPTPVLTWTRNGSPVTTGSTRFQISTGGSSLTVTSVQEVDEATYVCSATNPAGTVTDSIFLNVIVPPEIVVLANGTATENQQHSMPCLATGDPAPSITWTYNGQVVPSQQGLLTFTPILRTNAGVYTCTASNSAGTVSEQVVLDVQYIPAITQAPQAMSVAAGTRVELTCAANGNPAPQISWLFNNTVIVGAQSSPYVIAMAAASNIGTYTCLSSNRVGIVSVSAPLAVFFPPSSPVLLSATPTSSQVISLRWSPSPSDGGSPITSHIIGYRDASDTSAMFQSRSFAASALEADLDNLTPFVTYEVRVQSENLAGRSPASNAITAMTHPDAPSAPTGFSVASFTTTSITLSWGMPAELNGQFGFYELRYSREDTFSTTRRDTLLFTSTFTIVGVEMGVVYRMEVRASTRSLIGQTLWGPFTVLRVRDGIELEVPTTAPTASPTVPPTTMATTTRAPSTTPLIITQLPITSDISNTDPITTQAPSTTQPSTTNPPPTQPPTTETFTTEPPSTEILTSNPPTTEISTSEPPSTRSPTTQPPPTEPPTTEAARTDAPSTTPPETDRPLTTPTVVPSGLTALIPPGTDDQVILFWMEPTMPGSFTGYIVLASPSLPPHIPTPILVPYTDISSTYFLNRLPSGTTYTITVATYNSVGLGPLTESVTVTPGGMMATSPMGTTEIELTSSGFIANETSDEVGETASPETNRDGAYYAVRIVPPIVGVLVIVAVVMGVIWCCVCARRVYGKKTTQKYEVAYDEKASQKFDLVDQINLKDIPEVEEQVDFAAGYDKNMVKEAFNANVFYEKQDSFTESDSDTDEQHSDQEVLVPYTSAVGRDAVQETEEDAFSSHKPVSMKPPAGQTAPGASTHKQQQPFTSDGQTIPAYSLFGGGDIMETRIGAVGSTKSGADFY